MSSMIKKKGALNFKPKAPGIRRPAAPPSATSSTRPSVDRQPEITAPSKINFLASSPDRSTHTDRQDPIPARFTTSASPPLHTSQSVDASNAENVTPPSLIAAVKPGDISPQSNVVASQLIANVRPQGTSSNAPSLEFARPANFETRRTHIRAPVPPTPPESQNHIPTDNGGTNTSQPLRSASDGHPEIEIPNPPANSFPVPSNHAEVNNPESGENLLSTFISSASPSSGTAPIAAMVDLSTLGAGESVQAGQLVPVAQLNPDGTSEAAIPIEPANKNRRPTKRRRLNEDDLDIRPTIEVQIHKPRRAAVGPKKTKQARTKTGDVTKRPKKRAVTPEDAEEQEVDHATVKMAELCKDIRIGRKFSKHAEIKQREAEHKAKAKLARDHPELAAAEENRGSGPGAGGDEAIAEPGSGVQMRLVNGQIVIDDRSLVVDRHARAAAAADDMEEIEENEFTRITTSGTHMKREKNIFWDFLSTEKFYNGLRMFGTDFEMISKMFPDRNRRQIKLKFNKEERTLPEKIARALIGEKVAIDLEEYKSHTGLEYESTAVITAEYASVEKEHTEEQERLQALTDETTRQKKAAIQGRDLGPTSAVEPGTGAESAKENYLEGSGATEGGKASAASKSKKKGAGKKKRPLHSIKGGGEDVEVVGTI
jgi:transcription factor TFIIIB component B''